MSFDLNVARGLRSEEKYSELLSYCLKNKEDDPAALRCLGLCYRDGIGTDQNDELAFSAFLQAAEKGDSESLLYLGEAYFGGYGTDQDLEKAFQCFSESYDKGVTDSAWYLGVCYENGMGTAADKGKAFSMYKESAEKEEDCGLYNLGRCFFHGIGTKKDYANAFHYLKKSYEQGNADACYYLAQCYENGLGTLADASKAVTLYREAADNGDNIALCRLALCYEDGRGVKEDKALAAKMIEQARKCIDSEMGAGETDILIGDLCSNDELQSYNIERAYAHYELASMSGNPEGTVILAECVEKGYAGKPDPKKAFRIYNSIKDKSDIALLRVGVCYQYGIGMKKNPKKAYEIYSHLIDCENEEASGIAKFLMGVCLYHGVGCSSNPAQALELFSNSGYWMAKGYVKALTSNNPDCYQALSCFYLDNRWIYTKRDPRRAFQIVEKAYREGSKKAIHKLASYYLWGFGTKRDPAHAYSLCEEENTISSRQINAEMLYYGCGRKKNYTQAFRAFRELALHDEDRAQLFMGLCYLNGYGVQKNIGEAYAWFGRLSAVKEKNISDAFVSLLTIAYPDMVKNSGQSEALLKLQELTENTDALADCLRSSYVYLARNPSSKAALLHIKLLQLWLRNQYPNSASSVQVPYYIMKVVIRSRGTSQMSVQELISEISHLKQVLAAKDAEIVTKDDIISSFSDTLHEVNDRTVRIEKNIDELFLYVRTELVKDISEIKTKCKNQIEMAEGEDEKEAAYSSACCSINETINNRIKQVKEIRDGEEKALRLLFGKTWMKMQPQTQLCLISARYMWMVCKDIPGQFDFSGVCICATSALETEIKKHFYLNFQRHLYRKYNQPESDISTFDKWPEELLSCRRDEYIRRKCSVEMKKEERFTLGDLMFIFAQKKPNFIQKDDNEKVRQEKAKANKLHDTVNLRELEDYLKTIVRDEYKKDPVAAFAKSRFVRRCDEVRNKYRNKAAHGGETVSLEEANNCYREIMGQETDPLKSVTNKTEAYEYQAQITGLLMTMFDILDVNN